MKKHLLWIIVVMALLAACSQGDERLEYALRLAGDNRVELQKVLDKYKNDADKYRAACFLIENMPFYGSYDRGKEWEKYRNYFVRFSMFDRSRSAKEFVDSMQLAEGKFMQSRLTYQCDVATVDSAFLTRHIEWAFKVWQEQPWGKHICLDDFFEYVLPYRIGDEPLSLWREELYDRYNPLLDELRDSENAADPIRAAQILMDTLRKDFYRYTSLLPKGPHLGPEVLDWKVGSCREFADAMIYVLRAVGIPCGTDRVIQRSDTNASHFWNFVLDANRGTYMAEFPYQEHWIKAEEYDVLKGKIYRVSYSLNEDMTRKAGEIPNLYPVFRNPFFHDVTADYAGSRSRTVTVGKDDLLRIPREGEAVYFCMANWQEWMPVAYTTVADGRVSFNDLRGGVVGIMTVWNGTAFESISHPFVLEDNTGELRFLAPDKECRSMNLYRKFYMAVKSYFAERMVGGVIEGSGREDFSDADTLFVVQEAPYRLYTTACLKSDKPYRYMRYKGGKNSYCNIAELTFYENMHDTLPLLGSVLGTPGAYGGDERHAHWKAFDGDTDTSFDYKEADTGWVGLDFGKPFRVAKAVYTPRNDVNFIYKGDRYELFYWGDGRWNSVGMQVAESDSLVYSAPANALYYLKNHTTGKDERIFEYRDGKQIFW